MVVIGNLLWLVLGGFWLAAGYLVAGLLAFLPIVTIPFGVQALKLAGFALWPFGRVVIEDARSDVALSLLGNVVWFVVAGLWLALAHVVAGVLLCLTLIGIPFGIASFKMAVLALAPFGKRVVTVEELEMLPAPRVVVRFQTPRAPRKPVGHKRAGGFGGRL
jgi:uncharacterized membrane protein YccF (DUF307 family)